MEKRKERRFNTRERREEIGRGGRKERRFSTMVKIRPRGKKRDKKK